MRDPAHTPPPAETGRGREETRGALVAFALLGLVAGARSLPLGGSPGAVAPHALETVPVDLNAATEAEIALLPGLGPDRARRIVVHREIFGPFRDVGDVGRVKGIGAGSVRLLREHAVAGGERHRAR